MKRNHSYRDSSIGKKILTQVGKIVIRKISLGHGIEDRNYLASSKRIAAFII